METPNALGIIAGSGAYPLLLADAARKAGVQRIVAAAFTGETNPQLAAKVDQLEWMRVGQLARLCSFFRGAKISHAIMAGQIAPKNLFDLRPDWKALLLIARLKRRNAESIFGAIADELEGSGIALLPAFTFLESEMASAGLMAGRPLSRREESDVEFGFAIAKEISRLNIGQTVVVRSGTVLAVEAFEGTNEAIRRGAALGQKGAVVVKVAKPNQDLRFDIPVIGRETIAIAAAAHVRVVAVNANRTLLLEREAFLAAAVAANVSILGR
ncbi:MAG: UDP-2,3-diacylglucosamine diphosphatase LpxI [Chthoniobacterales bacterium]|nr:UDP-2,3-diacylglucosamine diphosphatase LpxI [Chthoniobacterales bacterium]